MITKCRFCDYSKEERLSLEILKILAEKDLPEEDYYLWMKRLVKSQGLRGYTSVKIHMGMKHKAETYKYISPDQILTPKEKAIFA